MFSPEMLGGRGRGRGRDSLVRFGSSGATRGRRSRHRGGYPGGRQARHRMMVRRLRQDMLALGRMDGRSEATMDEFIVNRFIEERAGNLPAQERNALRTRLTAQLAERRETRPMSTSELSFLPTHKFRMPKNPELMDEGRKTCRICLCEYEEGESVKTLPCFHQFHEDCIDQWLKKGKRNCPICKNVVRLEGAIS